MTGQLTFVGTATTVLELGDFTLLTDPNFLHRGQYVHLGYGLVSRRRSEPALSPAELPPLDAVLLSHLHGDHFDRVARRSLARHTPIITTPHGANRLGRWGFADTRGLRDWQQDTLTRGDQTLRITSVPGTHAFGVLGKLLPPVMGSVVELERGGTVLLRLYLTGDTLFRRDLTAVTERFGRLDAMITHLGGTKVLGALVTMDGQQGADLVELLRPPVTVPVHYDDYTVFKSPLLDFLREVQHRELPGEIRTVRRGQTISLQRQDAERGAHG